MALPKRIPGRDALMSALEQKGPGGPGAGGPMSGAVPPIPQVGSPVSLDALFRKRH